MRKKSGFEWKREKRKEEIVFVNQEKIAFVQETDRHKECVILCVRE